MSRTDSTVTPPDGFHGDTAGRLQTDVGRARVTNFYCCVEICDGEIIQQQPVRLGGQGFPTLIEVLDLDLDDGT